MPARNVEQEVTDGFSRTEFDVKLKAMQDAFDAKLKTMQEQLEATQEQLDAKTTLIQEKDTQIKTLKAGKAGWLITAPIAMYDGVTLGVQFINGQAFIPDDRVIDAFIFKPMKEHDLEKMKEDERKAVREREAIPSSARAAQAMHDDFGYTIQHFDGEDGSLQGLLDARAKERSELQAVLDAQNEGAVKANNLLQPTRFAGASRG